MAKYPRYLGQLAAVVVTVLAFVAPVSARGDGCDECLPGGDCEWYECQQEGSGCWECKYRCPDGQLCTLDTCTGFINCN